jgi:hypothetical protein
MSIIEVRLKLLELARSNGAGPLEAEKVVKEAERLERFVLRPKEPDDPERR